MSQRSQVTRAAQHLFDEFSLFSSNGNDNCPHFGPFAWPTHKGGRRQPDKDSDKFRKTDQLPMMVSQCALCPALVSLGSDTAYVTRAPGHQWTPESRRTPMDTSRNFRPPTKPAAHAPATPLADANYDGNLHQK